MANLTKREIVLEIYKKTGFPQKQIVDTVQQTLDIIQAALAEGRNVELRNFGVLEVQVRKQRVGRNPNKPEAEVIIPQRAVVKFKSGKVLSSSSRRSISRRSSLSARPTRRKRADPAGGRRGFLVRPAAACALR